MVFLEFGQRWHTRPASVQVLMDRGNFPLSSSCRCYLPAKAIARTTLSLFSSLHTNFPSILLIIIIALIIIMMMIVIIIITTQ